MMKFSLFPTPASTSAYQVDWVYYAFIGLSVVFLAIIYLPLFYFLFKYRRGNPADRSPVTLPVRKIEITWTVIPLVLLTGLFLWSAGMFYAFSHVPPGALEVNVVGKQWMWKLHHAAGKSEINELHVPVGRTVKVTLTSEDVIHSFYLPAFRLKTDVYPGQYTVQWFTPTRPGIYHLFCAEYCGKDHSRMIGRLVVMEPAAFEEWLRSGVSAGPLALQGERLYRELGCSGCHQGSQIVRAPRLEGLYGQPVPLADGRVVLADDGYLRDSILLPMSQIVAGYAPVMPSYAGHLSEDELVLLLAYLKSLGTATPEDLP